MTYALLAETVSGASSAFGTPDQDYLFEARQLQALSFVVHIPLVCFGVAFPAFVVFAEWLHMRTGDETYRVLARRWSKVMLALFAVGVVTGTILSFEMGLLWPNFMATFGDVFGLGFAIEGISFFVEAIFIGIYVYGWDRLSPRAHILTGIPIIISGFTGSLMVIAVNAWMNHPSGFKLVDGRAVDVDPFAALFENSYLWHELIHMYIAGYMVAGFVTAGAYAWIVLRGDASRYHRVGLIIPLTFAALASPVQVVVGDWAGRDVAQAQPVKLAAFEGLAKTESGAPVHLLGWYDGDGVRVRDQDPQAALAARLPRPEREGPGPRLGAGGRAAAGERRPLRVPDHGRHRDGARRPRRRVRRVLVAAPAATGLAVVLPRPRRRRAALGRRPAGRLGHDRGRAPAVGRLRRDAHGAGRHRCERHPGRLRDARARLRGARGRDRMAAAPPRARAARSARADPRPGDGGGGHGSG